MQQKQQSYQKSQSELNDMRRKLDAEQAKVGSDRDPQYDKLKAQAQARDSELAAQQQQLESAQHANAKQLADAEAEIARLKAHEQELQAKPTPANDNDMASLRMSAAQMDTALREGRKQTQQLQQQMAQGTSSSVRKSRRNSTRHVPSWHANTPRTRIPRDCSS